MDLLAKLVTTKPISDRERGEAIVAKSSDDAFALFPTVYRLMTEKEIAGVKRELSKISIKLDDQGFVTTFTEPASGQVLFNITDNLFRVLEALEARLTGDKPGWVPDKYALQRKKKK